MALPILHNEFQLQRCLSEQSHARTYLATNARGHRFVVKFIFDPDHFFEEMARYYACDSSPYLCRLVYNFPAYTICGQPCFFEPDILKTFGNESLLRPDGTISEEDKLSSPIARMGALVFEYVQGAPLLHLLPKMSDQRKIAYLDELAEALGDLHANGEFHGNLTAANVLVEDETKRVKLVGMGHGPASDLSSGAAEDVRVFALRYLSAIEKPAPPLIRLEKACLQPSQLRRPSITKARKKLRSRNLNRLKTSGSWLMVSLVAASLLIAVIAGSFRSPSQNTRPVPDTTLARAGTQKPLQMPLEAMPDAIFSFREERLLLIEDQIFALGDQFSFQGRAGALRSIQWDSLVIANRTGDDQHIALSQPGTRSAAHLKSGVLVWSRPNTLGHILAALPRLQTHFCERIDTSSSALMTQILLSDPASVRGSGMICGTYEVSSLNGFLESLNRQVIIKRIEGMTMIEPRPDQFLHYVFKRVYFADSTVAAFGEFFQDRTGIELTIPGPMRTTLLPKLDLTDTEWDQVLRECGFEWNIRQTGSHSRVIDLTQPARAGAG